MVIHTIILYIMAKNHTSEKNTSLDKSKKKLKLILRKM